MESEMSDSKSDEAKSSLTLQKEKKKEKPKKTEEKGSENETVKSDNKKPSEEPEKAGHSSEYISKLKNFLKISPDKKAENSEPASEPTKEADLHKNSTKGPTRVKFLKELLTSEDTKNDEKNKLKTSDKESLEKENKVKDNIVKDASKAETSDEKPLKKVIEAKDNIASIEDATGEESRKGKSKSPKRQILWDWMTAHNPIERHQQKEKGKDMNEKTEQDQKAKTFTPKSHEDHSMHWPFHRHSESEEHVAKDNHESVTTKTTDQKSKFNLHDHSEKEMPDIEKNRKENESRTTSGKEQKRVRKTFDAFGAITEVPVESEKSENNLKTSKAEKDGEENEVTIKQASSPQHKHHGYWDSFFHKASDDEDRTEEGKEKKDEKKTDKESKDGKVEAKPADGTQQSSSLNWINPHFSKTNDQKLDASTDKSTQHEKSELPEHFEPTEPQKEAKQWYLFGKDIRPLFKNDAVGPNLEEDKTSVDDLKKEEHQPASEKVKKQRSFLRSLFPKHSDGQNQTADKEAIEKESRNHEPLYPNNSGQSQHEKKAIKSKNQDKTKETKHFPDDFGRRQRRSLLGSEDEKESVDFATLCEDDISDLGWWAVNPKRIKVQMQDKTNVTDSASHTGDDQQKSRKGKPKPENKKHVASKPELSKPSAKPVYPEPNISKKMKEPDVETTTKGPPSTLNNRQKIDSQNSSEHKGEEGHNTKEETMSSHTKPSTPSDAASSGESKGQDTKGEIASSHPDDKISTHSATESRSSEDSDDFLRESLDSTRSRLNFSSLLHLTSSESLNLRSEKFDSQGYITGYSMWYPDPLDVKPPGTRNVFEDEVSYQDPFTFWEGPPYRYKRNPDKTEKQSLFTRLKIFFKSNKE